MAGLRELQAGGCQGAEAAGGGGGRCWLGRKLAPRQMATVSTRLGGGGDRQRTMPGTPGSRCGAGSQCGRRGEPEVSGCELAGEADCHVGWAARGQAGKPPRSASPSSGSRASSPAPTPAAQASSPAPPGPGPYSAAPRPPVLRRPSSLSSPPLPIVSSTTTCPDSPHTPLPAPTTTESSGRAFRGAPELLGRHGGAARGWRRPAPSSSQPPGSRCSRRLTPEP